MMMIMMVLKTKIFQSRGIPREQEYKLIVMDRHIRLITLHLFPVFEHTNKDVSLTEGPLLTRSFDSKEEERRNVYIMES